MQQNMAQLVIGQIFTLKVLFDTVKNLAASMFSFTLHVKSYGSARNRATRLLFCVESRQYGWCELIIFRGVDPEDLGRWLVISRSLRMLT